MILAGGIENTSDIILIDLRNAVQKKHKLTIPVMANSIYGP